MLKKRNYSCNFIKKDANSIGNVDGSPLIRNHQIVKQASMKLKFNQNNIRIFDRSDSYSLNSTQLNKK